MKFSGIVIRGDGDGKLLGYPTANIDVRINLKHGIYPVIVFLSDSKLEGVLCYGVPGYGSPKVEVHIFDYVGDLYGRELEVEVIDQKISELEDLDEDGLRKKIARDIEEAKKVLKYV